MTKATRNADAMGNVVCSIPLVLLVVWVSLGAYQLWQFCSLYGC